MNEERRGKKEHIGRIIGISSRHGLHILLLASFVPRLLLLTLLLLLVLPAALAVIGGREFQVSTSLKGVLAQIITGEGRSWKSDEEGREE